MKFASCDFEYNCTSEPNVNLVCCAIKDNMNSQTWWLHNDKDAQKELAAYIRRLHLLDYTFLAHNVVAEASSFLALGLAPEIFRWIDTFIEFRMLTNHNDVVSYGEHYINGKVVKLRKPKPKYQQTEEDKKHKNGGKLTHSLSQAVYKFCGEKIDTAHKNEMRDLIISNPETFSKKDKNDILEYCASDVVYLKQIYTAQIEGFKRTGVIERPKDMDAFVQGQLWRGETMARTAKMERAGYPLDYEKAKHFSEQVPYILRTVQKDILEQFPDIVPFAVKKRTRKFSMKTKNIRDWIQTLDKDVVKRWQKTEKGALSLSYDAFSTHFPFRHNYPRNNFGAQMVRYLHLKQSLNGFIPSEGKKTIWDNTGSDQIVRPYLNAYGSQTARYQPSATGFIFLKAAWLRALVQPPKGKAIVGIDYGSEEFLISALVSKDKVMVDAYRTSDVYLAFSKSVGMTPKDGTRETHEKERNACKSAILGMSYSMSKMGLSAKLTQDTGEEVSQDKAQEYIDLFNSVYSGLSEFKEELLGGPDWDEDRDTGTYEDEGYIKLVDGWTMFGDNENQRSVGNLPIQGFGGCILRKAIQLCQDEGLEVIIPLHDALYILTDAFDYEAIATFERCMREAFIFYFEDKESANLIRLDSETWSPDYVDLSKEQLEKFGKAKVESIHIDGRSKSEYEKFKKYFEAPEGDLI